VPIEAGVIDEASLAASNVPRHEGRIDQEQL